MRLWPIAMGRGIGTKGGCLKQFNTNEIQETKIKILIYGKSGVGKTSSVLSLKPENTLIISDESGLLALAGKSFDVWRVDNWDDLHKIYADLLKPENQTKYKTIMLDSLTELNEMCKDQIVKKDRPEKGINPGKVYDEMMTMADYGLLQTRMMRFIRSFRDLPYHVIMTCLEDSQKDETTGATQITPSLNGKLASNVSAYFDEVFWMITKEEDQKIVRYFVTGKVPKALAKDRSGSLELYEPANLSVIFKKILSVFKKADKKNKEGKNESAIA